MLKKSHLVILAFALAGLLAACGGNASASTEPPATVPPPTQPPSVPTEIPATVAVETVIPTSAPTIQSAGGVSFAKDVLPILKQNCTSCHGGSKSNGGFSISTYRSIMAGSKTGPVIQPGDGPNSYLVQLLQAGKMPRRGPKLADSQIQIIIDWINAGALDN